MSRLIVRNYRCFTESNPLFMPLTSGMHAIVGPNNVGKSAALKMLYEFYPLWIVMSNLCASANGVTNLPDAIRGVTDQTQIFCNRNSRPIVVELEPNFESPTLPDIPVARCIRVSLTRDMTVTAEIMDENNKKVTPANLQGFDPIRSVVTDAQNNPIIQIPAYQDTINKLFHPRFIPAIRTALSMANGKMFDIPIGLDFASRWRDIKTGTNVRENRLAILVEKMVAELFGFGSVQISVGSQNEVSLVIDDHPFRLSEVGSGLSNMLCVLTDLAVSRPRILLIDEPEAGLHPRLQQSVLTMLASMVDGDVYFATHSLGLARAMGDTITSLYPSEQGVVCRPFQEQKNYSQFLGEMSFAAWSEIGFDKVLLVEGATDNRTFKELLRKVGGQDRVFVMHLGGSSSINGKRESDLADFVRLNRSVFVLIDSERSSEMESLSSARSDFLAICGKLGYRAHVTHRRATENYFPQRAIDIACGSSFQELGPFDKLGSLPGQPAWAKVDNWKIAREMNLDELVATDIGKFLTTVVDV